MRKLIAFETFRILPNPRFFNDIKIEIGFPFSEISFNKKDFDVASQIVSLQFLCGYNDHSDEDRKIYLNNYLIKNKKLYLWEDEFEKIIINFKKEHLFLIKENNKFIILIKDKEVYNYILQTLLE